MTNFQLKWLQNAQNSSQLHSIMNYQ